MAKLRHIAIACDDLEATAKFYEDVFGMERVGTSESSIADGVYLSDGGEAFSTWRERHAWGDDDE